MNFDSSSVSAAATSGVSDMRKRCLWPRANIHSSGSRWSRLDGGSGLSDGSGQRPSVLKRSPDTSQMRRPPPNASDCFGGRKLRGVEPVSHVLTASFLKQNAEFPAKYREFVDCIRFAGPKNAAQFVTMQNWGFHRWEGVFCSLLTARSKHSMPRLPSRTPVPAFPLPSINHVPFFSRRACPP